MGGNIAVESEPAQGSRFTIIFSLQASTKGTARKKWVGDVRTPLHVCLAEDNTAKQIIARIWLQEFGWVKRL
jgi:hypothetical protein